MNFMKRLFRIAGFLLLAAVLAGGTLTLTSCSEKTVVAQQTTIQRIQQRGVLLVGTTGDYRPLTYREEDGTYWGFGIELADTLASRLGVGIRFVPTSWPMLTADVRCPEFFFPSLANFSRFFSYLLE